jgi:hypothetical protein
MPDIKQAIEYAKANPNSAFANELRSRIESGKMDAELSAAGISRKPADETTSVPLSSAIKDTAVKFNSAVNDTASRLGTAATNVAKAGSELVGDINKRGQTVMSDAKTAGEKLISETGPAGKIGAIGTFLGQAGGQVVGSVGDMFGRFLEAGTSNIAPEKKQAAIDAIKNSKPVQDIMTAFSRENIDPEVMAKIDSITKLAQDNPIVTRAIGDFINVIGLATGGKTLTEAEKLAQKATEKAIIAAKNTASGVSGAVKNVGSSFENAVESTAGKVSSTIDGITSKSGDVKKKLIEFAAPEADAQTKTILRESKPSDIDRFVKLQEAASADPRAMTPYEAIGDSMSNATKQLSKKASEIGAAKSEIVGARRAGLESFDASNTIEKLNSLNNSISDLNAGDRSFVQGIIDQAKGVKTKIQADKFIDDVQQAVYNAGTTKTIAQGSKVEKQVRGILKAMNDELKASLPKEYSALNDQYSKIIKVTNALNLALGETIDGISTRGGSLVKQFFSPNGRKAKELFRIVKEQTGIDLAKDATLARYVMQLYGDTRANTLLGGNLPTSVSGAINKALDFAVEKTGIGEKVQTSMRKAAIQKAKSLAK